MQENKQKCKILPKNLGWSYSVNPQLSSPCDLTMFEDTQ